MFFFSSENWAQLTSDPEILTMVTAAEIETDCELVDQARLQCTVSHNLNEQESAVIDKEIDKVLKKKIISPCDHTYGEIIFPICARRKIR